MVRNIISNQDVDELLSSTVGIIEDALHEYGLPHKEPVFIEEHVKKIDGSGPVKYKDVLTYKIEYDDGFKLNDEVSLTTLAILIIGTSDNAPKCHVNVITANERKGKHSYVCTWSLPNPDDFNKVVKEFFDDSIYEDCVHLDHLLCRVRMD